ncbi:DUF927 domain-containing protein [Dechloromonas denitrificans]|uniref:DUF927 domain-containing protein n=1 Tax=Dechloromonas denitrificans TaxID=281362 RepID=UPI001CFBCEC8|nr:DUF927 domain-containing protein [Dechloromonas denitrificans]UCV09139.1 DUF927 domain-containing protein [Dechloromonas denitrificans]
MTETFIHQVVAAALSRFDEVMAYCGMASGKDQAREYLALNPKRSDGKLGSLSINRDTGAGSDFATGETWGDLVAMTAWRFDCSQIEAAERLADLLGIPKPSRQKRATGGERTPGHGNAPPRSKQTPAAPASRKPAPDAEGWECVIPVPEDSPPPPAVNPRQGKPSIRYEYRTATGRLGFLIDRYQGKEGKSFAQLTLWRNTAGRTEWRWKSPPAPRLLYGLDLLAARPEAPVIVCEGEKAAEAVRVLFPEFVCISWPGGSNAVDKADWSPLTGRDVTLWPDLDDPGAACMVKLASILAALAKPPAALYQVKPQAFGLSAKGDDGADLVGWDAVRCADVCTRAEWRAPVEVAKPAAKAGKPAKEAAPAGTPRTCYHLEVGGVYFTETDRDGNQGAPKWICSYLEPIARVRNPDNQGWGLLARLYDADKVEHKLVIPMTLFRGDGLEVAGMLLDAGLTMATGGRQKVIAYLQSARPEARARITSRTGWHATSDGPAVYVLPNRAFGNEADEWLYEAEGSSVHAFKSKGSAEEWRNHVGRLCRGNSRLLFAVSVAFASPLLYLVGGESGGFHYRSNSSDGKTTALRVACSVCGDGGYMQRWRATDNGLEALAMQHCDALLALDELAQLDPKVAGETAYMLANGAGKTRAARTGGARERAFWRVLFLSAGEISLAQHMAEANRTTRAGQEIRLVDIAADAGAGLGAWETLHDYPNGADFSRALDLATKRCYGAPLAAFLDKLTRSPADLAEELRKAQKLFEAQHLTDDASGQARRVADRFALVAMGGELATQWGLTGWEAGEALAASGSCYRAWLAGRGGEGNQEETSMLNQVREFFERHGDGAFDLWHRLGDDRSPRTADSAGVRRWIQPDGSAIARASQIEDSSNGAEFQTEFFVFEGPWRNRVCKGLDYKAVNALLSKKGILRHNKGRFQSKQRIPGKGQMLVYHITPELFEGVGNE